MLTLTKTFKVLMVEDNPLDAELLEYELRYAGIEAEIVRVDTEWEYQSQLYREPDFILSDYSLPDFDALRALHILQSSGLDIPFIVVTGSISEEVAVECMKHGASDYLLKDRLTRLGTAVRQALKDKRMRDDQRRAEIALRNSEERYRQMFENNQAMKLLINPLSGAIIDANSAACIFYGYSLDELTARRINDLGSWDENPLLETERSAYFVFRQELASGEEREVEVYSSPIDVQESPMLFWIVHDITERKRMEAALLESELKQREMENEKEVIQLKERFTSMVSHEFRTPLTIMSTSTHLLKTHFEEFSNEKRGHYLQQIEEQIAYMASLMNDVLVISQARGGKLDFKPALLDLEALCANLVEQLRLADGERHAFIFKSEGNLKQTLMDERLLRHILVNLLSNAIKYSPIGKSVRFELSHEDGEVVFKIKDEGMGIPLEDQKRLFEPFHRASNVQNIEGTGLGLAIVHNSVVVHGGTITCESAVGQGTTFTVRLPFKLE